MMPPPTPIRDSGTGQPRCGETLPLFEDLENSVSAAPAAPATPAAMAPGPAERTADRAHTDIEKHMQTAIRLSEALRRQAFRGRKRRPRVANAICEHLLASLRMQTALEREQRERERAR